MPMQISISNAIKGDVTQGGTPTPPSFASTKSFQFDGQNDLFNGITNYTELNAQNKATFSFWIKPTYDTAKYGILFHVPRNTQTARSQFLCFLDNSNRIRWSMTSASTYVYSSTNAITLNQWNHILICVDLIAVDKAKIFINGVDETSLINLTATQFDTSSGGLMIAEETQGYLSPFDGNIDEFSIWSGSDQRANVSEIYNGGLPNNLNTLPTAPQPTTWQRMGEDAVWDGSKFVMTDVNGGYVNTSFGILPSDPNPTTDVPLFDNKSFTYDGVSDFVNVGNPASLSPTTELSISAWFKSSATSYQVIASKTYYRIDLINSSGRLNFIVYYSPSNFTSTYTPVGTSYQDGQWHHVLCTHQVNGRHKIFVDGVLLADATSSTSNIFTGSTPFIIGNKNTSQSFKFNGSINDVSFFDNDQSANASTIFNGGIANDISALSPLGYWRAEQVTFDGTDWTLIDQGSGGNNGTSVSMPLTSRTSDVPTVATWSNTLSTTFDGTDDFCETASTYSELNSNTKATWSVWVKPNLGGTYVISRVSSSTSASAFVYQFVIVASGEVFMQIGDTTRRARTGSTTLADGVWSHILVCYDGTLANGSKTRIFINGIDATSTDSTTATSLNSSGFGLQLGRRDMSPTYFYSGFMDEVAIWSGTDESANVSEIYNGGLPNDLNNLPTAPNPTTWYRMGDGDTYPTILDKNGSANITMTNMSSANFVTDVPT